MKKRIGIFFLLGLFFIPDLFAAAGTEGREFWVALTIGRSPEDKGDEFEPFICVSSKTRQGTVTVSNPITNFKKTYPIPQGTGWCVITDIPVSEWYPYSASTKNQQQASGQSFSTGLQVSCSEDMSVYAAIRYRYAFDASNILPTTALQSDYIIQDYPPFANESPNTSYSNFCILATEDNTQVQIIPSKATFDGRPADQPFTVTLNKGQVYYVVSQLASEGNSEAVALSGSQVNALDGKKIAVFAGDICTRVPYDASARDINYEQAMPVDYWGTEFIVTRSVEKDANRVRITAQEDGTTVNINGLPFTTLNSKETCEIELAVAADFSKGTDLPTTSKFVTDVAYIQTSCPCAVYNYDTGNAYKSKASSQLYSDYGDPSATWVSPLEQKVASINFGTMNTSKTTRHFVNIVTETSNVPQMQLMEVRAGQYSNNLLTAADFLPVPALPNYSYARKALSLNQGTTYHLEGEGGFIAHVYGNGKNESYAYSVGSAAVKRGIQIGNDIWQDGVSADVTYCVGEPIHLNAQVGSDIIDRAIWDMGDGVTVRDGAVEIDYTYEAPGWYDITATLYAHKECPLTTYPPEDVHIALRVVIPDTIRRNFFICEGETLTYGGEQYTEPTTDTVHFDCDSVVIFTLQVGAKSYSQTEITAKDSCLWNGTMYYQSGDYEWAGVNAVGCDSVATVHLKVITCLEMNLLLDSFSLCGHDQTELRVPFNLVKGDMGETVFTVLNKRYPVVVEGNEFVLDISQFNPNHYAGVFEVQDTICDQVIELPFVLEVLYDGVAVKWDNTLAVYNKKYNGGYDFTAFQWFKNGVPIEGATGSWFYNETPFEQGDEYSVLLTCSDGTTLLSCPKEPYVAPQKASVRVTPTVVSAGQKVSVETTPAALVSVFNPLGMRESQVQKSNEVSAIELAMPARAGLYMLQVVLETGETTVVPIMVK